MYTTPAFLRRRNSAAKCRTSLQATVAPLVETAQLLALVKTLNPRPTCHSRAKLAAAVSLARRSL